MLDISLTWESHTWKGGLYIEIRPRFHSISSPVKRKVLQWSDIVMRYWLDKVCRMCAPFVIRIPSFDTRIKQVRHHRLWGINERITINVIIKHKYCGPSFNFTRNIYSMEDRAWLICNVIVVRTVSLSAMPRAISQHLEVAKLHIN